MTPQATHSCSIRRNDTNKKDAGGRRSRSFTSDDIDGLPLHIVTIKHVSIQALHNSSSSLSLRNGLALTLGNAKRLLRLFPGRLFPPASVLPTRSAFVADGEGVMVVVSAWYLEPKNVAKPVVATDTALAIVPVVSRARVAAMGMWQRTVFAPYVRTALGRIKANNVGGVIGELEVPTLARWAFTLQLHRALNNWYGLGWLRKQRFVSHRSTESQETFKPSTANQSSTRVPTSTERWSQMTPQTCDQSRFVTDVSDQSLGYDTVNSQAVTNDDHTST